MHYSAYYKCMWEVYYSDEYEKWFEHLSEDCKIAVFTRVCLLQEFGPNLSRPYADTLKGSKINNLKELRCRTESHVLRIAYLFDPARKAFILTGGDKKGKNEKKFYKDLISEAEFIAKKNGKL